MTLQVPKRSITLTPEEQRVIHLRIAALEDMVDYLLHLCYPEEDDYAKNSKIAKAIIKSAPQKTAKIIKNLTPREENTI